MFILERIPMLPGGRRGLEVRAMTRDLFDFPLSPLSRGRRWCRGSALPCSGGPPSQPPAECEEATAFLISRDRDQGLI